MVELEDEADHGFDRPFAEPCVTGRLHARNETLNTNWERLHSSVLLVETANHARPASRHRSWRPSCKVHSAFNINWHRPEPPSCGRICEIFRRRYMLYRSLLFLAGLTLVAAPGYAQTGNGAPSGAHYNLNIIGMKAEDTEDCKKAPMTDSNRHTIFVDLDFTDPTPKQPTPIASLNRRNKIYLQEGPFQVIDGNACDGDEAIFQLPLQECATATVETVSDCAYDVYIRGLGSPQGSPSAVITTCGISPAGDEFQCSLESVTVTRTKQKSSFTNVTKELTTLCIDTIDDGVFDGQCDERVVLFGDDFAQYFWDYDNNGLRLAQLRFYVNGD